jgi:hypothetical protein
VGSEAILEQHILRQKDPVALSECGIGMAGAKGLEQIGESVVPPTA